MNELGGVASFTTKKFDSLADAEAFVGGRGFTVAEMAKLFDEPSEFLVLVPKKA